MKTTLKKAERVSRTIGRRLQYPRWYLGVAITPDGEDGYMLAVRVERGHRQALAAALPSQIEGVKISVVEDTMARPLTRTRRTAT